MDAVGDEQTVQSLVRRALDVGGYAVADAQHALARQRPAQQAFGLRQSEIIDRRIGLARHHHRTVHRGVEIGQGAAAVNQLVAPLHHPVGIGANHGQAAPGAHGQAFAIVVRRLALVVHWPGAGDEGGQLRGGEVQAKAVIQRPVAVRAELPGGSGRPFGQQRAGGVARADKGRPGRAGHAELIEPGHHVGRGTRRVGDQHDGSVRLAEPLQRRAGLGERLAPVVDHPPHVAQQRIVAA